MTIQSTFGGVNQQRSGFVEKLMNSAKPPDAPPEMVRWLLQLALRGIDLQARNKPTVTAFEDMLKAFNTVLIQLTGMKAELRERLLYDMASRQKQLSNYQDDGTVKVFNFEDGRSQTYSNISEVMQACEDNSSLSKPVILQFQSGSLVLTSDFRMGRVLAEISDDVYEVDLGNGKHVTYSAKDLSGFTDENDSLLNF